MKTTVTFVALLVATSQLVIARDLQKGASYDFKGRHLQRDGRGGGERGGGQQLQEDGTIKACESLKKEDLSASQRAYREQQCFDTKLSLGWIDADGNEIVQENEVVADTEVAGDENEEGQETESQGRGDREGDQEVDREREQGGERDGDGEGDREGGRGGDSGRDRGRDREGSGQVGDSGDGRGRSALEAEKKAEASASRQTTLTISLIVIATVIILLIMCCCCLSRRERNKTHEKKRVQEAKAKSAELRDLQQMQRDRQRENMVRFALAPASEEASKIIAEVGQMSQQPSIGFSSTGIEDPQNATQPQEKKASSNVANSETPY